MPYSTYRILGINHGQQAFQQKCPVPLCQLTDSSSPVAVLQLYLKQNHFQVLERAPLLLPSSLSNFQVPKPSGMSNDWAAKGVKGARVKVSPKGHQNHSSLRNPTVGNLLLSHQAPKAFAHHELEKEGTQGAKVITCSARLFRTELCCTYQLAGITGKEEKCFKSTNRHNHIDSKEHFK